MYNLGLVKYMLFQFCRPLLMLLTVQCEVDTVREIYFREKGFDKTPTRLLASLNSTSID